MCATCAIGHADAITLSFFKNSHKAPPKPLGHLRLRELRRQPLQKFAQKTPQPTALKPPSTALTSPAQEPPALRAVGLRNTCLRAGVRAEVIGQSVGSDASPLSCFLFRPRKSREKRRKRSHTNVSNASVTRTSRVSQTPLQTPIPYFHQWVPHGKKTLVAIACKTAHIRFCG